MFHRSKQVLKYPLIRTLLAGIALGRSAGALPGAGGRGVIFTLHHVRPEPVPHSAPNAGLTVSPAFLEQAIAAALGSGLVPVHLHELPALLADPKETRKFVAFTLDDGYRNNAEHAAPVFRRFAVPYTIFVTSGFVERSRTLWWETAARVVERSAHFHFDFGRGPEEVRAVTAGQKRAAFARLERFVESADEDEAVHRIDAAAKQAGIDPRRIVEDLVMNEAEVRALATDPLAAFGAHTVSHVNLRRVAAERLRREVEDSILAVEKYAGRRPRSFAYPYGWAAAAGEREAQAVAAAGIGVAVTTRPGILGSACLRQPRLMPRMSLNGLFQKRAYVEALISGIPFSLVPQARAKTSTKP